jgi:hypothetical protein
VTDAAPHHKSYALARAMGKSRAGCSTARPWVNCFDSFIHTIVLDKIMIVSGVEYIKEVLLLGMAATGPPAGVGPKKGFYRKTNTSGLKPIDPESFEYDGENYRDLWADVAFAEGLSHDNSRWNWDLGFERRTHIHSGVTKAIRNKHALTKKQGLADVVIDPAPTVVKQGEFTNDMVHNKRQWDKLVVEIHALFTQLQTLVEEIKVLETTAPPPPAAAAAPAAAAGAVASTDERLLNTVKKALGKWNTIDMKGNIEMLVQFEDDVTRIIGITDHPEALLRLVALIALEFGAKAALPLATNDDTAALLKKIQETEQQLKANKVILDEYTATKVALQGLMYEHANKWSDVIPTIESLKEKAKGIDTHTPEVYKQNGKLQLEEWRKEFDDRQVKIEAYVASQVEVQKALYDKKSWEEVLPEIKILKDMCDVFVQQTPKVFNDSNTLDIVKWRAEYDRLVSLRDAMWDSFTTEFKDKIKIEDVQWAHQFKLTMGVFGVYRDNEVKLLGLMKVAATEILPTITALMKLRTDTFAAIPESCKKDKTVDNITECVGLWSAEYTKLVGLRKHIKDALLFPTTEINTDDQIRARCVEYVTDLKAIFDACAGTGVTVKQCPKLLDDLEELLDPIKLAGSVAQIETWKNEVARLTKLITDGEEAAKKAVVDAAGGEGAAAAAAEATRKENVRLTSELGACEANWVRQRIL